MLHEKEKNHDKKLSDNRTFIAGKYMLQLVKILKSVQAKNWLEIMIVERKWELSEVNSLPWLL